MATAITKEEQKHICNLSNGAISNDPEWQFKVTTFFNVK